MKKLAIIATAIATAATPLAVSTPAVAFQRGDHDRRDRDRDHDRRDHRDDRRDDRRDGRRGDWRDDQRSAFRRDHRGGHRDRWERRRYNGYYWNNRFYYGPPPAHYYGRQGFHPGYRAWRRGERLPPYYRTRYVAVNDYYRYRLRPPPRGYRWVRDDRGDYLLVGVTTGLILGLILGSSGY